MSKNQQSFLFQKAGWFWIGFAAFAGLLPGKLCSKIKNLKILSGCGFLLHISHHPSIYTTWKHLCSSAQHRCCLLQLLSFLVFPLEFSWAGAGTRALLHDYFLYDWHNSGEGHTFHAFTHARDAFVNAQKEFELSRIEREVIKSICSLWPRFLLSVGRAWWFVWWIRAVPCTKPLNKIHILCSEKVFVLSASHWAFGWFFVWPLIMLRLPFIWLWIGSDIAWYLFVNFSYGLCSIISLAGSTKPWSARFRKNVWYSTAVFSRSLLSYLWLRRFAGRVPFRMDS